MNYSSSETYSTVTEWITECSGTESLRNNRNTVKHFFLFRWSVFNDKVTMRNAVSSNGPLQRRTLILLRSHCTVWWLILGWQVISKSFTCRCALIWLFVCRCPSRAAFSGTPVSFLSEPPSPVKAWQFRSKEQLLAGPFHPFISLIVGSEEHGEHIEMPTSVFFKVSLANQWVFMNE